MWISKYDKPIPTYGNHGKEFLLNLKYCKYFGHDTGKSGEVVVAIWDSFSECFYEKETSLAIDNRDIIQWWNDDNKVDKQSSESHNHHRYFDYNPVDYGEMSSEDYEQWRISHGE